MTTDTTFQIDTDTAESQLQALYLPKRRREVAVDAPSQAEEELPHPHEPTPVPESQDALKAPAPDDGRETLFAEYMNVRNKQIRALARAYEYELRAHYERRDPMRAIFAKKRQEESEHAAMYEAYADSLLADLEEWSA